MKSHMMKTGNFKSVFKQVISLLISMCIIGQSSSTFAMQTPKQQREEFIDYLKEEQDRYKTLFDQEALLEELDYDTDNIIDFVSNKIVYQAYDGVLRGAKGTLIGRAGNSHDQAITLAGMLNDAGLEAEILVGKLTAEQATELNLTIASPQFSELKNTIDSSKSIMVKNMSSRTEEIIKKNGVNISTIMSDTNAITNRILKHISPKEIQIGAEALKDNIRNSSLSYRWVRYRLAQGSKWIEMHPAYTDAKKWNLTPEYFEKNQVNPDDLQQFSVEVWIENSAGEKHSITGLWKKPSANLMDHTISIEIASNAMIKNDLRYEREDMLKQSYFFFIQIDGKLPKNGKVFDLNGNIYSGDSLSGLNSVFSTINKKSQEVVGALSSLSINKDNLDSNNKQLTKVWLEFTLDKPNSESRKIKRVIFDQKSLLDETNKVAMHLLQRWDIDISTTTPMQQFYHNKKAEQIVTTIEGVEKIRKYFKNNPDVNKDAILERYYTIMGNPNSGLLTHKRSIFDRFKAKDGIVSYIYEPNILVLRRGILPLKEGLRTYEMTDIISNSHWSLKMENQKIIPTPRTSINRGIWETLTESAVLLEKKAVFRTDSAYKTLAQSQNYSTKTISKFEINLLGKNEISWWNVDLQSGSTIGMMELKQGIGGTESTSYVIKLNLLISFVFALIGTQNCIGEGRDIECCILANSLMAATGYGLGHIITLKLASAIVLVGSSVITDVALGEVPVPSLCPMQ